MYNPAPVFRFVSETLARGQGVVLVTIAAVTGGSARNPGTHLAVSETGAIAGSLSGGCIEAAVAAEALEVLREGQPRMSRYGAGSRFVDIRLPCGGSLDLLFTPLAEPEFGEALMTYQTARQPFTLAMTQDKPSPRLAAGSERFRVQADGQRLVVNHVPALRMELVGQGVAMAILRQLAEATGIEVAVSSPDPELVWGTGQHLASPATFSAERVDRWTAGVVLFHDHDWEPPILAKVLERDGFYVGAMGSRAAHAARCEALRASKVPEQRIAAITAPIGLIPSLRDPETLAVSILAEVLQRYLQEFIDPPRL